MPSLPWAITMRVTVTDGSSVTMKGGLTLPFSPTTGLLLRYPLQGREEGFIAKVDRVIWHATLGAGELSCSVNAAGARDQELIVSALIGQGYERI